MFELMVVSLMVGAIGFICVDLNSDYKGNIGIEKETNKRVCIILDDLSYYMIRYEDGSKTTVKNGTIKPIDELCI